MAGVKSYHSTRGGYVKLLVPVSVSEKQAAELKAAGLVSPIDITVALDDFNTLKTQAPLNQLLKHISDVGAVSFIEATLIKATKRQAVESMRSYMEATDAEGDLDELAAAAVDALTAATEL